MCISFDIRIALEVVYEAVIDAGINPKSLRGARVGVFMSSSGNDAADVWLRSTENRTGHYITGCYPCMLADRISYAFNFKGPTCVVDTGCSSSFSAIQYAMLALKNGLCDSAIVGGANINTFPYLSSAFFNFKALSSDGKCKVFDASADGFVRSEAVVAFYICRNACAKRIYATILGIKCINDGYKEDGITVPSSRSQAQLIKEVYEEAGVNPMDVFYVEAHGTGTQAGDPKEIAALDDVFCKERREPLLVGSVKSNMGHAELVSGLCGIVKVLLARRYGVIPPNLHFKTPNPECEALIKGRINVVVEATPFQGRLVGVNSFGIGGTTGHAILQFENISNSAAKWRIKTKTLLKLPPLKKTSSLAIPTLILASGRTKKAVEHLLDQAAKHFEDTDFLGLLHEVAAEAVTVPAVYSTVLYSFFIRGKLKEGERVLIHSGSGGIGMAAITIALNLKCTVYTTVGSRRKRDILKAIFPKLLEDRILDSNNGKKFKMEILRQTKGEGVDVVLNSLSQDKLKASLECLGRRG
ncbi:unnamed protein product, partial [Allacma fusca]